MNANRLNFEHTGSSPNEANPSQFTVAVCPGALAVFIEMLSLTQGNRMNTDTGNLYPDSRQLDLIPYLKTNPGIALIGATNDSTKYGNIIFCDLRGKNYRVFPVNPRATTVEGEKAYKSLTELQTEQAVGLLVYVIPPKLTLQSLSREALPLGLRQVWVQPGAGDPDVRAFLDKHRFQYLMDACVMVETRR